MLIKFIFAVSLSFSLLSCGNLHRGQIDATQKFAQVSSAVTKIPADIYYRIYLLRGDAQSLQLNTVVSTNDQVKESVLFLKKDFEEKMAFLALAEEYSAAYEIVEQYAHLVASLLDPAYQKHFAKTKVLWQVGFEKMLVKYNAASSNKIPGSVGAFTATLVQEIGKLKFGAIQKKYLRQALQTGYEPLTAICDDYLKLDSSKIQGELKVLPAYLENNFASFLENMRAYEKEGNNPYDYYATYSPIYHRWLGQLNDLNLISMKTNECFRHLKTSYKALLQLVESNGKNNNMPEIEGLLNAYGDLLSTYSFIDKRRDKLNAVNPLK